MWQFRLWDVQDVAVFLSITLYICQLASAISIYSPQRSLTRSVQEDVLFSVDVTCTGTPTVQWTFMSGAVSRFIGTWQLGGPANITLDYSSRVQNYSNGSMGLSDLRLQDAGFYVITVTEETGSSKDAGFVLKVNEVLYEDLQYLSVAGVALAGLAGLLALIMWLVDKAYWKIKEWRCRKEMPVNDDTELHPL
ncbi:V-set and transmembrane domain-containing protein 5 [Gouania willdenowi]|uniref:V-set and transmembrane domain-containing protein 5 n=1 Tax=Gouania willdenowi TaxID=441366 RepID=UPI001054F80C|nr:V-set and transmembrane domain-containing protein 5 [Gouania willdenowi]XP_028320937.1 V-set and transmembrane domain-containing protein 5 [Gouania willdenowi]XP_028320938.1 V-set and transmembrane domain-containing protein 5 [Gouania willdenowi]XP_028320939.1 V-set and transmembrane domain-containing protein 5 [Gouania willdenowi]